MSPSSSSTATSALSPALRHQITTGLDSFLKSPPTPRIALLYQTKPGWPSPSPSPARPPRIAVLDSSFNPPHLAHLALASSTPPAQPHHTTTTTRQHYNAHLLLLSSRNADKGLGRPGDATPLQRLLMMAVLARDLEDKLRASGVNEEGVNVAVGVCEEPLMKDKSSLVHGWLAAQEQQQQQQKEGGTPLPPGQPQPLAQLNWVVGFDTITRFFDLKYYPSPSAFSEACNRFFTQEGTTFVCARRGDPVSPEDAAKRQKEEREFLESELVRPWVESGGVSMFDLPEEVRHVDSTGARGVLREGKEKGRSKETVVDELVEKGLLSRRMAEFVVQEEVYE